MQYGNNSVCSNYVLFTELLVLHRNSFINPWKFTACTCMPVCQVTIDTCTPTVTLHTNCQLQLLITAKQCTDTGRRISALSVEGWHNRINQTSWHGKVGVHQLTQLHCEADCVTLQVALVPEECVQPAMPEYHYQHIQGKVQTYWKSYANGTMTSSELLRVYVYGPSN